jgi:hypothetical protein
MPTNPVPNVSGPPPPVKKTRWPLYGCGALLTLMLIIVASVVVTVWWIQRPIKPVVLTPQEKAAVEQKLRAVEDAKAPPAIPNRAVQSSNSADSARTEPNQAQDRPYVPGSKVLKLTEREVNGLLNQNTDLGKSVRLEFARDAINAYLAVPIPQDFPVGGGKMFRARGRFRVSLGNGGTPYAILEDVTVFGLSLPKAWLGGLKGENLLSDAMGERNGSPPLKGVKSLRVEPGALVIEVED